MIEPPNFEWDTCIPKIRTTYSNFLFMGLSFFWPIKCEPRGECDSRSHPYMEEAGLHVFPFPFPLAEMGVGVVHILDHVDGEMARQEKAGALTAFWGRASILGHLSEKGIDLSCLSLGYLRFPLLQLNCYLSFTVASNQKWTFSEQDVKNLSPH